MQTWDGYQRYCGTCGEDCERVCKYTGEESVGLWTTEDSAAQLRQRVPLLILQRQHEERQRETLDWLTGEAEGAGFWLWTPDRHDRRGWATHEPTHSTEVSEIRDTLGKHSAGWYAPVELRKQLEQHPEMYYWKWSVRRPEERVEWLAKSKQVIQEAIDRFSPES